MLSLRRNRSARLRATMRAAGVVLLGALLTGCGSFQPAPTETRVVASGEFEVSIEQGLMVINAVINGEHPVRMVLDTGADATVLTPAAVERIGLDTKPMMRIVRGAKGGGLEGSRAPVSSLDLGGLVLSEFDALVLGLAPIQRRLDRPVDGVVGWPAFRDAELSVDWANGRISTGGLREPGSVAYPLTSRRATIEAPIFGTSREYLVDTGYNGTLAVRRSDLARLTTQNLGEQSITGAYRSGTEERFRVDEQTAFGGARIPAAEVVVTDGTRVMGSGWMRRFTVTFDQPAGEIRFLDLARKRPAVEPE